MRQPSQTPPASAGRLATQHAERRAIDAGRAEAHERERMREQDEGLIDAARHLLRPAAQLRPKRRQHAGIAGKPAEHAAREADRGVGRFAAEAEARKSRREKA